MAAYIDIVNEWIVMLQEAITSGGGTYTPAPDMSNMIPRAIAYVEDRVNQKMTWLATRKVDTSLAASSGSRSVVISSINCRVVEGFALIVPSTAGSPAAGTRVQFDECSLDLVDASWPTEAVTLTPTKAAMRGWAMKDDKTIVIFPTPDANYPIELTGQFAMTPLSSTNTTNYLSQNYENLYLTGGMVYWSGFQRDFGAQSDDPRMAMSWESQFKIFLDNAVMEEQRRRGLAPKDGSSARMRPVPSMATAAQGPQQ